MPPVRPPSRPGRAARLLAAVALLVVGSLRLAPSPSPASAAVGHVAGYRATVLGWTSWYGSYDLGPIGVAWCIDHGLRAPDPAFGYEPTALAGVPASTRTALAWAYGRYGPGADRITSAALMLVGHDLMGASYPYGRLDVGALGEGSIAGFGSDGPAVLARARAIRADALANAERRGPWSLTATVIDPSPGVAGTLTATVTAGGQHVAGIAVSVLPDGAELEGPATALTGADGTATFRFAVVEAGYLFGLQAIVPDLDLQAFAATSIAAQRVVRPATVTLGASVERLGTPPIPSTTSTTSTTVAPTTSTTVAPTTSTTTSTTLAPSTTTIPLEVVPPAGPPPPTTAPPTTPPPSSTATTTATTTGTTPAAPSGPPVPAPGPPAIGRTLPRTGSDLAALAATGVGLVLLGSSLPRTARRHPAR